MAEHDNTRPAVPAKVAVYASASHAESTQRVYASAWRRFDAWCQARNTDPTRPSPETVATYLADIAPTVRPATVTLHLAAIRHTCGQAGFTVARDAILRNTARGIQKVHAAPQLQAAALSVEDIVALLATCEPTTKGIRDRALLLVGFAGAFRREELVGIDVEHLTWTEDGVAVFLPRSKEDQESRGAVVFLPYGEHKATCPVRALRAWLDYAGITMGPAFQSITKGGKRKHRLIGRQVNRTITERATLAGVVAPEGRGLSSHSLRTGFVTAAYRAGVLDEEIMGHTRHKGHATMRGYVRREALSNVSPAGRIGL